MYTYFESAGPETWTLSSLKRKCSVRTGFASHMNNPDLMETLVDTFVEENPEAIKDASQPAVSTQHEEPCISATPGPAAVVEPSDEDRSPIQASCLSQT